MATYADARWLDAVKTIFLVHHKGPHRAQLRIADVCKRATRQTHGGAACSALEALRADPQARFIGIERYELQL